MLKRLFGRRLKKRWTKIIKYKYSCKYFYIFYTNIVLYVIEYHRFANFLHFLLSLLTFDFSVCCLPIWLKNFFKMFPDASSCENYLKGIWEKRYGKYDVLKQKSNNKCGTHGQQRKNDRWAFTRRKVSYWPTKAELLQCHRSAIKQQYIKHWL